VAEGFLSLPNPANELSARLVAGDVVVLRLATILPDQLWLMVVIAYGFVGLVNAGG
jgi:hypothetical protein